MLEEKGWTAKLHQDGERGFHQMLSCLGRRWGPQEEWCNRGGGHYQRPTFTGSTSQAGHPEGTIWALSTRPGAVGTPGNTRVLTPASATDIYPGDGHKYENTMLLPKRSILAQCWGGKGGEDPFFAIVGHAQLSSCCGGNYFCSKPYVEHQQMHILWSRACCKRDYKAGNL